MPGNSRAGSARRRSMPWISCSPTCAARSLYLNVFLVTQRHWSQTEVGWVTTVGGLFGLAAQTPIGR